MRKSKTNFNRLQKQLQRDWKRKQQKQQEVNPMKTNNPNKTNVNNSNELNLDMINNLTQDLQQWVEYSNKLQQIQNQQQKIHKQLSENLSVVDQEITDIRHLIELGNFNASQGYKLAKELQTALQRRRQVKTQLDAIDALRNSDFSAIQLTKQQVEKEVQLFDKPMYYNFRQREDLKDMLELKVQSRTDILRKE